MFKTTADLVEVGTPYPDDDNDDDELRTKRNVFYQYIESYLHNHCQIKNITLYLHLLESAPMKRISKQSRLKFTTRRCLPAPDDTQTTMLSTKNYVPPGTAEWGQ